MNTSQQVFAVVETQFSNFGLTPFKAATLLGYRTMLISKDPERFRALTSAGEVFSSYVDEVVVADTNSTAELLKVLRPVRDGGNLAGVYTLTDYSLVQVAEAAEHLSLPGLTVEAARKCVNKLEMRKACHLHGVRVPKFEQSTSLEQAIAVANGFGYPCVLKPMTESASIGVTLCRNEEDVRTAFESLTASPFNFRGQLRPEGVLVEEYIVGFEVSVESFHDGVQRHTIGVTDKNLGPHPFFVEMGETFPSMLSASTSMYASKRPPERLTPWGIVLAVPMLKSS